MLLVTLLQPFSLEQADYTIPNLWVCRATPHCISVGAYLALFVKLKHLIIHRGGGLDPRPVLYPSLIFSDKGFHMVWQNWPASTSSKLDANSHYSISISKSEYGADGGGEVVAPVPGLSILLPCCKDGWTMEACLLAGSFWISVFWNKAGSRAVTFLVIIVKKKNSLEIHAALSPWKSRNQTPRTHGPKKKKSH